MVRHATQDERDRAVTVRRDQEGRVTVSVPVRFYRRNGRQTIVADSGQVESHDKNGHPNAALIKAIAKAYLWQEQLESGEFATIEELAYAKKIDVSYARRMFHLNSLAPDIVEAILQNDPLYHLSLRNLYRGIAPSWVVRRRWLLEGN